MTAEKKAFALRLSAEVFDALTRWADDDLRSLNAQIAFLLRDALRKQGRLRTEGESEGAAEPTASAPENDTTPAR
jgi:hypothetical protein